MTITIRSPSNKLRSRANQQRKGNPRSFATSGGGESLSNSGGHARRTASQPGYEGSVGAGSVRHITDRSDGPVSMSWVEIVISDTGCGIPAEKHGLLLRPFSKFADAAQGAGLLAAKGEGSVRIPPSMAFVHDPRLIPLLRRLRARLLPQRLVRLPTRLFLLLWTRAGSRARHNKAPP